MKKRTLRIVIIISSILLLVIVSAGIYMYNFTQGSEKLSGKQEAIPEQTGETPSIAPGDADWNSWQGPNFDKKSTFTGLKTDWTNGLEKLWDVSFLCQDKRTASWAATVIKGDVLVVPGRDAENDLVFCLNANTGELIWKSSYKAETQSNHGPGARATPFIEQDKVYTFGRNGDLVCWQLQDGKMVWHKKVSTLGGKEPQWGHSSSPIVINDMVVVQVGGDAIAMAFDKNSGDVKWKTKSGVAGYAPINIFKYNNQLQLLLFHGQGLAALDTDNGNIIWDIPWQTDYNVNATIPLFVENKIFISSGYETGCELITVENNTPEVSWTSKAIEAQHTDPVIIDGYIYCYSGNSSINNGDLVCLRLEDGKEMWRTDKAGQGTLAYADGHLICFDIKGNLYLVEVNPQKFVLKAEIEDAMPDVTNPAWTEPVIANGKLYLRYLQHLICYSIDN